MGITKQELESRAAAVDTELAARQLVEWLLANVDSYIDNHKKEYNLNFFARESDGMEELAKIESMFDELEVSDIEVPEVSVDQLAGLSEQEDDSFKRMQELLDKHRAGEELTDDEQDEIRCFLYGKDLNLADLNLDEEQEAIVKEESEKLTVLYDLVEEVKKSLLATDDLCRQLFEKMVFYYELAGVRGDGDGNAKLVERNLDGYVKVTEFLYEPYELPVTVTEKKPLLDDEGDFILDENGDVQIEVAEQKTIRIPPSFTLDLKIEFWEKPVQTSLF